MIFWHCIPTAESFANERTTEENGLAIAREEGGQFAGGADAKVLVDFLRVISNRVEADLQSVGNFFS